MSSQPTWSAVPGRIWPGAAEPGRAGSSGSSAPNVTFTLGLPVLAWDTSSPVFQWVTGEPYLEWAAGTPAVS